MSSAKLSEGVVVAGRFRLERLLGKGGMGSVWRAVDIRLETPCALKFIEGDLSTLPDMVKRFQREAKAAAELRSPHVVQVFDHDIWEGIPFIAMELLEGEDLRKRLDRVKRLSRKETIEILSQASRALTRAHSIGIVHRDLKPENIFISHDVDREVVKILDFGIAKRTAGPSMESNTKSGALLGTPYYMSPEQAQGLKEIDARSDLWSMAVIAFECLTGQVPFESEAFGDLLLKIMVKPLPVPSQIAPVPKRFDAWWTKAAAREPGERFQTIQEFIASLSEALGVEVPKAPTSNALRSTAADMAFEATEPPSQSPAPKLQMQTAAAVARTFSGAPPKKTIALESPITIAAFLGIVIVGAIAYVVYPDRKTTTAPASQAITSTSVAPPLPAHAETVPAAAPWASAVRAPIVAPSVVPSAASAAPNASPKPSSTKNAPKAEKTASPSPSAKPRAAPTEDTSGLGF